MVRYPTFCAGGIRLRRPIVKLKGLVSLHHLYFGTTDQANLIPLKSVAEEIQCMLRFTGHLQGEQPGVFDEPTRIALRKLVGIENLEQRWNGEGEMIDREVVEYLRYHYLALNKGLDLR